MSLAAERFPGWDGSLSAFDHCSYSSESARSSYSANSPRQSTHQTQGRPPAVSALVASRNPYADRKADTQLGEMLRQYILLRCSLNEHCCEVDFDHTALDSLSRMPFLQAMQTVEHFSASVSSRIHKKSAYLMGILRGQEAHWEKFILANGNRDPLKGRQILDMPSELLCFVAKCCLGGHCVPSDFTPEVCLNLHALPLPFALKAISAFNTNKRIIAGPKGGVINRARFFLRLIQNVTEQNSSKTDHSNAGNLSRGSSYTSNSSADEGGSICSQSSPRESESNDARSFEMKELELNLEELAALDFKKDVANRQRLAPAVAPQDIETRMAMFERELRIRDQREQRLMMELSETRQHLRALKGECFRLRSLLGMH